MQLIDYIKLKEGYFPDFYISGRKTEKLPILSNYTLGFYYLLLGREYQCVGIYKYEQIIKIYFEPSIILMARKKKDNEYKKMIVIN